MPGQVVTSQGSMGSEMYLLKHGSCDVSIIDVKGRKKKIGVIRVGQCFGEISLWFESKRSGHIVRTHFWPVREIMKAIGPFIQCMLPQML
jgi:CRP-like cAMP-binding protein